MMQHIHGMKQVARAAVLGLVLIGSAACTAGDPTSESPADSHHAPAEGLRSVEQALTVAERFCQSRGAYMAMGDGWLQTILPPADRYATASTRGVLLNTYQGSLSGYQWAQLEFKYLMDMADHGVREDQLEGGALRHQVGIKLRAYDGDGDNVLYVMWRFDPVPMLAVQVVRDDVYHSPEVPYVYAADQGDGSPYHKVLRRPKKTVSGSYMYQLTARVEGQQLQVWVRRKEVGVWGDATLVYDHSVLVAGRAGADFAGLVGLRSDNVDIQVRLKAQSNTDLDADFTNDPVVSTGTTNSSLVRGCQQYHDALVADSANY